MPWFKGSKRHPPDVAKAEPDVDPSAPKSEKRDQCRTPEVAVPNRTWPPAPASSAVIEPATVVVGRPTPRIVADPCPAVVVFPHPPARPVRSPPGGDAGLPNRSV